MKGIVLSDSRVTADAVGWDDTHALGFRHILTLSKGVSVLIGTLTIFQDQLKGYSSVIFTAQIDAIQLLEGKHFITPFCSKKTKFATLLASGSS